MIKENTIRIQIISKAYQSHYSGYQLPINFGSHISKTNCQHFGKYTSTIKMDYYHYTIF